MTAACRLATVWLAFTLVAVSLAGCGKSNRPALGQVTGRVTLAGQPLAGALVLFTPAGPGRTSQGVTDAEGVYELTYLRDIKGANLGHHAVRITASPDGSTTPAWPAARGGDFTHTAVVERGDNRMDFAIPQ
jgi:hypothetical protein